MSRFVLSLDLEQAWGMSLPLAQGRCRQDILGARHVIPRLLEIFERFGIRCTWATVGLLFFDDKDDLLAHIPPILPAYADPSLCPYRRISQIGANEGSDPLHYGLSLVRLIQTCPGQEIGSHTFSHYYCREEGQDEQSFRADLTAAKAAADRLQIRLQSLVFPRNQVQPNYLRACEDAGFKTFRGNLPLRLYAARARGEETVVLRALRLMDSFVPLSDRRSVTRRDQAERLLDVPASMFLRPVGGRSRVLHGLHIRHILDVMTHAAKTGGLFHLWWHPQNFGRHSDANLRALMTILEHYRRLAETYGMTSCTMLDMADASAGASDATSPWQDSQTARLAQHVHG